MANYRQTNHNGRVNAKTGKAYSRKHNDIQYDVTKTENIDNLVSTIAEQAFLCATFFSLGVAYEKDHKK